jgi:ketosteroid isomerase-like protein
MTGDKQHDATTELNEALAASFAADSFDGMGPFYTEDVHLLPPRGKMLEGREAVAGFWRNVANRFDSVVYTTTDLKQLGEAVRREAGTYAMGSPDDGQGVQGKYVFVWQLVDGEWQIESGIWNRSAEAGGRPGQGQGQGGRGAGRAGGGPGGAGPGGGRQGGGGGGQGPRGQGGGYRQGAARPSFQTGGAGIGGQRRGGGNRGGEGGGGLYEGQAGLYAPPKD